MIFSLAEKEQFPCHETRDRRVQGKTHVIHNYRITLTEIKRIIVFEHFFWRPAGREAGIPAACKYEL
jgi:hypothetical protein